MTDGKPIYEQDCSTGWDPINNQSLSNLDRQFQTNTNSNQSTNPNDLGTLSDNLGGFSDNFSFIDSGNLTDDGGGTNYSFINDSNNTNDSITTPLDGNVATSAIDKDYNKLLQERANM